MKNLKIFLVFAIMFSAALFTTGCTEDEKSMINMMSDYNNISQYQLEGVYGVECDFDENLKNDIHYTCKIDETPGNEYIYMKLSGTLEGVEIKEPIEFYAYADKIYVHKNILRYKNDARNKYTSDLTYLLDELDETSFKDVDFLVCEAGNDLYKQAPDIIFNIIGRKRLIWSPFGGTSVLTHGLFTDSDYNDSLTKFLIDSYNEFDSETVTQVDNGYQLAFGASRLFDTIINFAEYTYANRDEIYDKQIYYKNLFYDSIPCPDDETRAKIETLRSRDVPSREAFDREIDYFYKTYKYGGEFFEEKDEFMQCFDGSYANYAITENDGIYNEVVRALIAASDFDDESKTMQYYRGQTKTPMDISIELPQRIIGYNEYYTEAELVKKRINPRIGLCIEVELLQDLRYARQALYSESFKNIYYASRYPKYKIILKNGDFEYIDFTKETENIYESPRYFEYGYTLLSDETGNLYLPLRNYAKALGEDVIWDESTETVSVKREDTLIPIDGFLFRPGYANDDLFFCRIREFEKLGYKIKYTEDLSNQSNVYTKALVVISQ